MHRWIALGVLLACQNGSGTKRALQVGHSVSAVPAASAATAEAALARAPHDAAEAVGALVLGEPAWPPAAPEGVTTDFCIEAMTALDEETCYVLPEARTHELLLYLHGTIPPGKTSAQKTNLGSVLANAARRGKVAALLPRGRRGLAPASQAGWWGWPTSVAQHERWTAELMASFAEKRRKLESLVGSPFARLYVAGSSSGAYFATALALKGELEADAFAAISGGAWVERNRLETLPAKPFYVGYGRHDSVATSAQILSDRLRSAGWPVKRSVHPLPHGAREVYLDEALSFFREQLGARERP